MASLVVDVVVKQLHYKVTTLPATPSFHLEDHQLGVWVLTIEYIVQVGSPSPLLFCSPQPMPLVGLFLQTVLIGPKPRKDGWGDQNQESFLVSKLLTQTNKLDAFIFTHYMHLCLIIITFVHTQYQLLYIFNGSNYYLFFISKN